MQGGDHYRIVDVRFKTKYLPVLERQNVNRTYFEFLPGRPSNTPRVADGDDVVTGIYELVRVEFGFN